MLIQETLRVQESLGKVNISPSEIALIVDQYLCDNNLFQTRATFRMEAFSLFAGSSLNQVCKPSLNLGHILHDYITLKQQNLILYQERLALMQEKYRIQKLVQDVQNVVDTFHAFQRPIPTMNVTVTNNTPSGVCTGSTVSVQNTNTYNNVHWQQSNKSKNSEDGSRITKKLRGRPPGKKNQVKGLKTLPPLGTSATGSQVSTNSSCLETHPGTATIKSVTTCNEVVSHCESVMVCPDEEKTYKHSLDSSPVNSDTDTKNKRELDGNASDILLKNSIPNEFSIPCMETQKDQSHMDLSHINFSDLDLEYWSIISSSRT